MAKKRVHRPEGSRPAASAAPARPRATPVGARPRPAHPRPAGPRPSLRQQFEDASRPLVVRMGQLPTFLMPMVLAVMMFLGLVLPSAWSGLLLLAIALFLTWITALSWPTISNGSRVVRSVVNVGVLVVGVLKLAGVL